MSTSVSLSKVSTSGNEQSSDRVELSVGAAIAIVGVCLIAAFMVAFFCVLNFTDILVNNTAIRQEYPNESGYGGLVVIGITLLPGFAAYWLSKSIIRKD